MSEPQVKDLEQVIATAYVFEYAIDPIRSSTGKMKEIWLGEPYNFCVNMASVTHFTEKELNIFEQKEPRLIQRTSFTSGETPVTKIQKIMVPKAWADHCQDLLS